ncbi:MAG TPA: hypothetical protein VGI03_05300 [Verrucomicrobiae bacterium]|jgi:hypothetical protein
MKIRGKVAGLCPKKLEKESDSVNSAKHNVSRRAKRHGHFYDAKTRKNIDWLGV